LIGGQGKGGKTFNKDFLPWFGDVLSLGKIAQKQCIYSDDAFIIKTNKLSVFFKKN
jgi:hypothetical protein